MKFSIVIPAFNEEKQLPESLEAIRVAAAAFDRANREWELIVCDNNSTDRTAELARAGGARVVFEPVNQIGRARNTGASIALGEWLVFIDADSQPSDALFAAVIRETDRGDVLAGGCAMRHDRSEFMLDLLTGFWNFMSRRLRWLAGSFIFVRRAEFEHVGGFSADFYCAEELELSQRLKKRAGELKQRVVLISDASLVTSARKLELYSRKEQLRMMLTSFARPFRMMKSRDRCGWWYDGRR